MSTLKGILPDRAVTIIQNALNQLSSLQGAFASFSARPLIDRPTGDTLYGPAAQRKALQVSGTNPLNITGLIGTLAQPQLANANNQTSAPTNAQPGTIVTINNVISQVTGIGTAGPLSALAVFLFDTYANWTLTNYNPANYPPGTIFIITDWNVAYRIQVVSGSNAWVYWTGFRSSTQSGISAITGFNGGALGTDDSGLLLDVTDYAHMLQWSGSAWGWGPGEGGSGYLQDFAVAPTGSGWHACDGSSGVEYLKSDGTTGTLTLPNTASTAAYRKNGATYASSITSAAAPAISGHTEQAEANISGSTAAGAANIGNDTDAGITFLATGVGSTAAINPHIHVDSGHTHGSGSIADSGHQHNLTSADAPISLSGGDPVAHYTAITYFRQ